MENTNQNPETGTVSDGVTETQKINDETIAIRQDLDAMLEQCGDTLRGNVWVHVNKLCELAKQEVQKNGT